VTSAIGPEEKLGIAREYARASNAGEVDALMALYAPDAVVWHNFDQVEQPLHRSMATVRWLHRTVPDVAFTDVSHLLTDEGFLQRSVLVGTAPDGSSLQVPSCVVVTINADGRITRAEEYLDSGQLAVLTGPAATRARAN
jgi:ketosteroid isomerase-like protein